MFEGCPRFGGCPISEISHGRSVSQGFKGCPNSEISHGRSVSQGFGECPKDLKYKTNTFVWKMVVIEI